LPALLTKLHCPDHWQLGILLEELSVSPASGEERANEEENDFHD
jgi:hypothetical protein